MHSFIQVTPTRTAKTKRHVRLIDKKVKRKNHAVIASSVQSRGVLLFGRKKGKLFRTGINAREVLN